MNFPVQTKTARTAAALGVTALSLAFSFAGGCQQATKSPETMPSAHATGPGGPPATLPDKYQQPAVAAPGTVPPKPAVTAPPPVPAVVITPPQGVSPPVNPPATTAPAAVAVKATDLTHTLSKDEPFFTSMPGPGDKPAGMLKAGSKALLLVPMTQYSKVMTDTGATVYTATEGLEPIGK